MNHCAFQNRLAGSAAMAVALTAMIGVASAQDHTHHNKSMGPFLTSPLLHSIQLSAAAPPLWEGLGPLHYSITTASPQAQQYFDQGLRLTYAFNHAEARRAFREASRLDPGCALCFWGRGAGARSNINAPMTATRIRRRSRPWPRRRRRRAAPAPRSRR
jgi:hypothetical protein